MGIVRAVLIGCLIAPVWSARVRVTGSCKCGCSVVARKDAGTINVILMERDMGETFLGVFDADDVMNQTTINNEGNFTLEGSQWEFGGIEPYLKVIHRCDGPLMPKYINLENRFTKEVEGVQVYALESKDCLISCQENDNSQNKVEASPLKGVIDLLFE
ncbi:hypothetical protein WR25_16077 [Diploscapter pachys]|uniref:Transthyretin/hydroxyisourate hydrolase domain-containing protein n=1 Tax=Diploscapter pachys TaxID=2018661 RepID=A0A2A2KIM4_9BILA|nr:hypothetical protein WR25_16077 [Diploscapter pachys]